MGALVLLTASDSIIKWLSPTYALHEIMLVRGCVALSVTMIIIQWEGGVAILRTRYLTLHLVRGLLLVIANMFFFLGLATLALADAVALFFIAPLFISLMSQPVLGERVGTVQWAAIFVGLIGVAVMLRPGFGQITLAGMLPVAAAFAYACMQMLTRRLGMTDKAGTLTFYIQISFIAVSAGIGVVIGDGRFAGGDNVTWEFLVRAWIMPTTFDLFLILICGILVALGGYLMSQAYRKAEAAIVAPFEYTALPFAVFWGYQLWGDWPEPASFIGAALIVCGGLVVWYKDARVHRRIE